MNDSDSSLGISGALYASRLYRSPRRTPSSIADLVKNFTSPPATHFSQGSAAGLRAFVMILDVLYPPLVLGNLFTTEDAEGRGSKTWCRNALASESLRSQPRRPGCGPTSRQARTADADRPRARLSRRRRPPGQSRATASSSPPTPHPAASRT